MVGRSPLCHAVAGGHEEVVRLLLESDRADVNSPDLSGRTALHYVAHEGPLLLHTGDAIARLLLETGQVNSSHQDFQGSGPFHAAVQGQGAEFVRFLLNLEDIDVTLIDEFGRTPLSAAGVSGVVELVHMLLDTGKADVTSRDHHGNTSLHAAAAGSEL